MKLRVMLGMWPLDVNVADDFLIVNALNNAYNAILARTSLNKRRAIISTPCLFMKFTMASGINKYKPIK